MFSWWSTSENKGWKGEIIAIRAMYKIFWRRNPLEIQKKADLVLLRLYIRTNEKWNTHYAPSSFEGTSFLTYGPRQAKKCLRTCAKCADSDHRAHVQCIIWAYAFHSYILHCEWFCKRTEKAWSDCADAQADQGLPCPHLLEDTFTHGAAHIMFEPNSHESLADKHHIIL